MKKLLLCSVLLLISTTALALPMPGSSVQMHTQVNGHYGMEDLLTGTFYNTFCLEKSSGMNGWDTYTVDSVNMFAEKGLDGKDGKDPVSNITLWLYASFFDGKFNSLLERKCQNSLAQMVQNAIWYSEDEIDDARAYKRLTGFANDGYDITGWNIEAVNILFNGNERQSQLVGETAPVPEPATMFLLGAGLVGLAGLQRRKKKS